MENNPEFHCERYWGGLRTVAKAGRPLVVRYLESICTTLNHAIREHPRTGVLYLTARQPVNGPSDSGEIAGAFISSLQALINADLKQRKRNGWSVLRCRVRLIWRTELRRKGEIFYHLAILMNSEAYLPLGGLNGCLDVDSPWWPNQREAIGSMAERIQRAWATALKIEVTRAAELVRFPVNVLERIDSRAPASACGTFERLSGMTKAGNSGSRYAFQSFGCSESDGKFLQPSAIA